MKCRKNIHTSGGIVNDVTIYKNKVYRNVDNEYTMIYKYKGEPMDILVDLLLEGLYDDNYVELMRNFANYLIDYTKDDIEPIEYVTIVNNEYKIEMD